MRLTQRLLLGALIVVGVLAALIIIFAVMLATNDWGISVP